MYYGVFADELQEGTVVRLISAEDVCKHYLIETIEKDWNGVNYEDNYKMIGWEEDIEFWTSNIKMFNRVTDTWNVGCDHLVLVYIGISPAGGYEVCKLCDKRME